MVVHERYDIIGIIPLFAYQTVPAMSYTNLNHAKLRLRLDFVLMLDLPGMAIKISDHTPAQDMQNSPMPNEKAP